MSGLEGLSIAANVIQIVQACQQVYERLDEYAAVLDDLPETFVHTHTRMGVLFDALRKTDEAVKAGALDQSACNALLPTIRHCKAQGEKLNEILKKCELPKGASRARRTWKALASLRYDGQLEKIDRQIERYVQILTHHASTAKYVVPAERPKAKACSTVPYRPDPHFVERTLIMDQIETKLQGTAARVALVGLGGVGKSQLAIHYSHRLREKSPETWVFWVNAGQTASFEESLGSIANKAQILGYDKTDKKRFDVISEWLKDEENKWLMVLDNADDLNVLLPEETPSSKKKARKDATFQDRPTRDLLDLLPQTTNGSYIVTSRYKQAATRIILGEYQNIIEVPEMTEKEATLLLNKKLVNQAQEDDAQELVSALKCMPLCITQAAAFINEMSPRWTVKRYIEEFRKGDDDRAQLLEQDIYDARRDDKIKRPNSILRTWQISFDHIRRNKPAAARLLSLMSLFDPVAIPDSLLVDRYGEFRLRHRWSRRRKRIGRRPIFTDKKKRSTDCNLEEDLRVLLSFSLIATEADGRHFAMHSLVQFATKQWMEQRDDKDVWMSRYIRVLNDHYPEMDITEDPYETSEQLLKHAYAAFACVPPDRRTIGEWAFLAYKVGYYRERQLYDTCDVQYMYQVALTFLIRAIGWQAPETIRCACRLGKSLKLQSDPRYAEAEDIFRTILKIRKKTLGAAHRDTLAIMDELIHVLNKQGRLVEADALYEKAKSIWIRKYGLHDEGTQNTMRNQIDTLRMRRRYDEAKELAAFAFEGRKRATVEEYDDAWVTDLEHMALSMTMVGKLEKAEAILRDTLQYKEKTLGKTHNMAFKTVRLLATNLWNQGRYQECEELFKRAMQGLDDVANWEKVSVMRQLAWALCEQYKLKEAQELAKTVVEKSIEYLGEEHHETAFALWILGLALKRDKRLDEALEPLEKAYEIALRKQGMDHVDTKDYLQDLASLQEERAQREEEAEIRALCESSQTPDTEGLSATEEGTLASMGVEQLSVFPASAILDPENSGRSAITTEYATARVAICTA